MISQNQALTLRRLFTLARLWLPFILLGSIIAGGTVFVLSRNNPQQYKATAALMIGLADQVPTRSDAINAGQGLARTYAKVFDDPLLYAQAVDEMKIPGVT